MQFRKYDQQQKTIELTMTKSVTNLTQMTWGVISLWKAISNGTNCHQFIWGVMSLWKAYIYVFREPAPVFFGYRVPGGFQNSIIDGKATTKNHFLATAKKSLYIFKNCITTASDNNYSTKLAIDIRQSGHTELQLNTIRYHDQDPLSRENTWHPAQGLPAMPFTLLYLSGHVAMLPCCAAVINYVQWLQCNTMNTMQYN